MVNYNLFLPPKYPLCVPLYLYPEVLQSYGDLPFASDFTSSDETTIEVLFDLDVYWKLVNPGNVVVCGGLVALETVFVWVLSGTCGPSKGDSASNSMISHTILIISDNVLD